MYVCVAHVIQINFGKFLENGGIGYILKPEYMRNMNVPKPPVRVKYIHNNTVCEYKQFLCVCM